MSQCHTFFSPKTNLWCLVLCVSMFSWLCILAFRLFWRFHELFRCDVSCFCVSRFLVDTNFLILLFQVLDIVWNIFDGLSNYLFPFNLHSMDLFLFCFHSIELNRNQNSKKNCYCLRLNSFIKACELQSPDEFSNFVLTLNLKNKD